jgi:hypothetical protein
VLKVMRDQQDFDTKVRRAEAEGDDPPERAHRRILAVVIGAVVGYGLGAGFVVVVDRARYSGADSDLLVWLLGLPTLLAIAGAVIGSLVAAWPTVEDVDAPMRVDRYVRQRRAATSQRGQLPGSAVPPRYEDETPPQSRPGRHDSAARK